MFLTIEGIWQLFCLVLFLIFFASLCWRQPVRSAAVILFLVPTYLLKIADWPITVLELFLLTFFFCWVVKKRKEVSNPREFLGRLLSFFSRSYFVALFLILVGVSISVTLSVDWRPGAGIFKAWILEPIIFSLILADIIKSKKELSEVISGLVAGAVLVAAVSLVYKLFGQLTFDGRLAGWYLSPNHLAMFLAPGLILACWGFFTEESKGRKGTFLLSILILGLALYFTFSYGAWLSLVVAVVFLLFCFWKYKIIGKKQLLLVFGFLFFAVAFMFFLQLSDGNNEKLANLLSSPRSSWQSRLMVWQSADKILDAHWLFGIGPGLFQRYYLEYQSFFSVPYLEWAVPQPHNLFLAWWLQGGVLGLIGFLVLLVAYFKDVILVKQKSLKISRDKQLLVVFLTTTIVYILIHGLVDTTYWKNDLALVFWSIVSLGYIATRCSD